MSDSKTTSGVGDHAIADYDALVVARMLEFFDHRTPWHRGLWHVGTVLGLHEVVEYGETVEGGQPSQGLMYVCESMRRVCGNDPGLGSSPVADEIIQHLAGEKPKLPQTRASIKQLIRRSRDSYLLRWADAVAGSHPNSPPVELTARRIAGHLLDEGFSGDHLHGWLTKVSISADERPPLANLLRHAHTMLMEGESQHTVVVPLADTPRGVTKVVGEDGQLAADLHYLDQQRTLAWIDQLGGRVSQRPAAALQVLVKARDPWAAVERAVELVARVGARLAVGSAATSGLRPTGDVWVAGKPERLALSQPRRQVRVPALEGHAVIYQAVPYEHADPLDDALELLAAMEDGTIGAAITNGWAAIEGMLKGSNDKAPVAADRLADITACSFPVAELLRLAQQHATLGEDQLAADLLKAQNARHRVDLLGRALLSGAKVAVTAPDDVAACHRIEGLMNDPVGGLNRVRRYIAEAFRRLYNQRNLVMHSGSFRSVALRATLRTTPALVGAGFDRIVHEHTVTDRHKGPVTSALDLHARVEAN